LEEPNNQPKGNNYMAMNQEQATAALVKTNEVLVKISNETDALLREIKKLEDALAAAGGVGSDITPELEAAVKATAQRAHAIDELVEDVPQPE
jgi:ABC-type transporter Mla subunit MlaD